MKKKEYQVELYYGYEEGESDIYLSFEAADPEVNTDSDEIATNLAELLDLEVDDENFNYDYIYIRLPDSVVNRIKADAVREYLERTESQIMTT